MKTFSKLVDEWALLPEDDASQVAGYFLGALDVHLRGRIVSKRFIRQQLHLAMTRRDELLALVKKEAA